MYPPRTPTKSHDDFNNLIRNLSAKWSLQLPVRYAATSPSERQNPDSPQEKILTRIRFLYFKDPTALDGVIANFEEWARPVITNWKWKPQQERGTIPTSASGANVFRRDSFLKTTEIPESVIPSLLTHLSKLVDDEVYLVKARMESNQSPPTNRLDRIGDCGEAASTEKRPRTKVKTVKSPEKPKRQTTLDFRKSVPLEQSGLGLNPHTSPKFHRPESVPHQLSQNQTASAANGHPSSNEFLPSSGWLGHAESLNRSHPSYDKNVTTEIRPNAGVDQAIKGSSIKDTEVFDALPDPSCPPPPVGRDNNDFHPISTDNSNEATDSVFIKIFDAVHISHPSQSKKRSSDTTEDSSPRKIQCNFIPQALPEALKVSTYIPAPYALQRSLKNATNATTSATTSFQESFDSEMSFVETNASQFSVGSQLTQLTEPDTYNPVEVPDLGKLHGLKQHVNTNCAGTAGIEIISKIGFDEMPKHLLTSPFRARYEVSRFATRCNIPVAKIPLPKDLDDYDKLWKCLVQSARTREMAPPERCDPETWLEAGRNFENVTLTGDLHFCSSKGNSIFELQLKAMKSEMSCRLFRRFGNDRFLVIGLPSLEEKHFPKHLQKDGQALRKRIIAALIEQDHTYFGRIWKPFYVKAKKDEKKKSSDNQYGGIKHLVYFFAINGCDFLSPGDNQPHKHEPIDSHSPMDIYDLWDWFCPREQNKQMTYCKMFSRMALGLSKTYPTLVFGPGQIRRIPDVLAEVPTSTSRGPEQELKVMNDGCAKISRAAARAIAEMLGIDFHVPSAFQGRIGGAKGLWMVDVEEEPFKPNLSSERDLWIEISESQEKFEPHPIDLTAPDPDRVTFEVHSWAKPLISKALNFQLLPILEHGGVSRSSLARLLREDLTFQIAQQKVSMDDPVTFRKWNHDMNSATDERAKIGGVRSLGSLPELSSERINWLLDSGFHPKTCSFLRDLAWDETKRNCERLENKLNIGVGQSTYAYITCDPLKVLKEGEIHLCFSKTFFDPQSKFQDTMLHGIDVLVARLPAHLPSDIQKVKAVFKPELRRLKDIVVLPANGALPLAEMLSGGDYDGDRVWICWDPSIVNNFTNTSMPSNPPDLAALGINRDTTTVAQLTMTTFLHKSFDFCLEPNLLGMCTSFHEQMCYARQSIDTRGAVILSTLLGYLVDREKQGFCFTDEDWKRLRRDNNEIWPKDPPNAAYKEDKPENATNHIIDYLRFNIAKSIRQETLHDFSQTFKNASSWDSDLAALYSRECDDAANDPKVKEVLRQLTHDISVTYGYWTKNSSSSDEDRAKEGRFSALVEETYSRFRQILPPADSTHPLVLHWLRDAERNEDDRIATGTGTISHWSLLRASATFTRYHKCGSGKFPWYMAGRELGILKAGRAPRGKWRAVVEPMYACLKPDAGYVKRMGRKRELEEFFGEGADVGL